MSFLTRFVPSVVHTICTYTPMRAFHGLGAGSAATSLVPAINTGGLFSVAVRNNVRIHFPRPSERKRILRHGWFKRMSTPNGRLIIMRRILKGKHVLSH